MSTVIEVVTVIGAARAAVFDLELDVDVHTISMSGSNETATTSSGRRGLQLHDEVTFRARHFGLPWRMTSRITDYQHPRRFVDEQVRGPFRTMCHEHVFDEIDADQTLMTDSMTITVPGGPLGSAFARLLVVPYLRRLLQRRAAHIKRLAEASDDGL